MRSGVLLCGCLVLGAVGGYVGTRVAGSPAHGEATLPTGPAAPDPAALDVRRLERRLEVLADSVQSRSAEARAAPVQEAGGVGAAISADASLPDRLAVLERRVGALEKGGARQGPVVPENLGSIASKELESVARALVQANRFDDAQHVLKELLGRTDLDEEQRVEAEMQLGYSLRGRGQHAEAEARFAETLRRVGEDSERGAWLGFQLGWERYYQKDFAGASARMERSANATGVSPLVRVHSLYNAASFAKQAGDPTRFRALLERLLNDHAKDIPESQASMRTQAEAWLKELRGF